MLETFYTNFGFFGSIVIAFACFLLVILWIAGIAGITQMPDTPKKNIKLGLSVIFPPYPLCWLMVDMYRQTKLMEKE